MAQETILTLKEYKAQIDELKSSIGDLENATDRYGGLLNSTVGTLDDNIKLLTQQKNALNDLKQQYKEGQISLTNYNKSEKELKTAISELNQQINIQQKQANAAKGSYNDLNQTLALLKNSYKQLTEEERKSSFGKTMVKDINDLSEKLKKIDESMGDYHRNVGNYASAFDGVKATFGALGLSMQGLDPVFKVATVAGYGFGKMLDTLKAHPFVAIASILVMTFMKLKQAINGNEESSKKWAVAMSAFQPILNAITNGLDWLASKLVDVVSWVTASLPKLLKNVGNFAKGLTNVLGNVVDIILFIPNKLGDVMVWVNKQLIEGLEKIIGGVGEVLDLIGLDVGEKMKSWAASYKDFTLSYMEGIKNAFGNAGDYVKQLGVNIDKTMNKWASATKNQIELTKAQQKLDEERRKQEIAGEESLLKQQTLRNEIAESSGKKRVELLKELKKEIEDNGKKELELAQRTLEIEERKRALTPNSREANLYYEQLRRNVISVQAATEAATVRINKQITSTESGLDALATKSAKDAENAAQKASKDLLKNTKDLLDINRATFEQSIADLEQEYNYKKDLGLATVKDTIEFEKEKHKIITGYIQEQQEAIKNAKEDQRLLAEDRVGLETQALKFTTQGIKEETEYKIKMDRLWVEDRRTSINEILKYTNDFQREELINSQNSTENAINGIKMLYLTGKEGLEDYINYLRSTITDEVTEKFFEDTIKLLEHLRGKNLESYSQYQEELTKISTIEEQNRLNVLIAADKAKEMELTKYYEEVKKKFGVNSEEAERTASELFEVRIRLAEELQKLSDSFLDIQLKDKEDLNKFADNQLKTYQNLYKGIASIFGSIADIYEEGIRHEVEMGKISEEEAKKRFETVKAFQISEAVLSTLSGAVGAFMGTWKDESIPFMWMRAVLAGVNTAAVVGTGLAQIEKISHTNPYGDNNKSALSGSTSSSSVSSSVQAMPLLYEPADIKTLQNIQTQSAIETQTQDTRVYIVESDIQASGKRVEVRDKNTTW